MYLIDGEVMALAILCFVILHVPEAFFRHDNYCDIQTSFDSKDNANVITTAFLARRATLETRTSFCQIRALTRADLEQ
jgi:hypothetical protein